MKYDTINDGEATPLQIPDDGDSVEDGTSVAPSSTKNKRTSSIIVRTLLVGTAVGALLLLAGPSKMMTTMNKSRNADGMMVASKIGLCSLAEVEEEPCRVAEGTFSGVSCKGSVDTSSYIGSTGYCAGPGGPFAETHESLIFFETCYKTDVPNLPFVAPNGRCWTASHRVKTWSWDDKQFSLSAYTCDPDFDGSTDIYKKKGIWHISAPLSDGSCGYPCPEAYSLWLWPPPTE